MRFEAAAVLLFCAGDSFAFQLNPNRNGVRLWNRNLLTGRKVPSPIYAGFADDSPTATTDAPSTPPSATSSAFDDMLEKFALPLEFKATKDNTKADAAEEKIDAKDVSEVKSEKSTASTENKSKAATAETKAQPVVDKKEQVVVVETNDEKVHTVDTEAKVVAKEQKVIKKETITESDAEIVQKAVDDKKKEVLQKVEDKGSQAANAADKEAKLVQKIDDKQEEATKEKVLKAVQPTDETKEKVSQQQEPSSTTKFGPIVTPRKGFSDFGNPDRPEPRIKWDFGEDETKMKPTALGVNPNRKAGVMKMEESEVKEQSSPPKKEVEKPTVTEEAKEAPKSIETPSKAEATRKDTTKLVDKEEKISAFKSTPPITEIAPPSSSTDLIQTQSISVPSINLPESLRNVNLEEPGIIASGTVVLGIALSLALVQIMNKTDKPVEKEDEEGEPEPNLIQKVKDAGVAGAISYALWEAGFWGISIPICIVGYNKFTGHWPDFSNSDDMKQLGGEIFAFANVARLAVPLRISLALSTVPWINENIVQKFSKQDEENDEQQVEVDVSTALQEETFVAQVDENEYEETYMSSEWTGDEWQQEEMEYGYGINEEWQEEMPYEDTGVEDVSKWSNFEERLSNIETDAMRVASLLGASEDSEDTNTERSASLPGSGYLNYIDEYCEPGTRSSNCAGALKGYLDSLATTGAVASQREVTTIVGYLDSLSSNTTPTGESRTGAAFTTYLDALSSGTAPSPPSAKAVAGYLDDLTVDGNVGTRVVDLEGRLNKLESSISSLPDDIASRIISWQDSQDQKMSEELEKIKKMLEDTKS